MSMTKQFLCTTKMADEDDSEDNLLVGVKLLSEKTSVEPLPLGAVVLCPGDLSQRASSLRFLLQSQLPNLPPRFLFLAPSRCPLEESQELLVNIKQLISSNTIFIKAKYDKPKIGIIAKSDVPLGFVFADYTLPLPQLRSLINKKIPFFEDVANVYHFLDRNGWPISLSSETKFTVMEVLLDGSVCVGANHFSRDVAPPAHLPEIGYSPESSPPEKMRRVERENKDLEQAANVRHLASPASGVHSAKQLLISYVRAEAAQHALLLKQQLSKKGFSVYLDVHEIKSGVDWQDSLNYAVSNCEVFVPLVTPLYGETQWTNREVKLADVLGKHILPISFLDTWPPRCLAIQFATTQYICWKTPDQIHCEKTAGKGEIAHDIHVWEESHVLRVASDIGERLQHLRRGSGGDQSSTPSLQRRKTLMKTFCKLPSGILGPEVEDLQTNGHRKQFVVICAHPTQKHQAEELRGWLESQGYSVWWSSQELSQSDVLPADQYNVCKRSELQDCNSSTVSASVLTFQGQADEADFVIVLLSSQFIQSRTCIQQVFYCEHRKQMVPVKVMDVKVPGWLNRLIGDTKIQDMQQKCYKESLLTQLKLMQACNQSLENRAEKKEAKICEVVKNVKEAFCKGHGVYISGATELRGQNTKAICSAIGQALAGLNHLTLVTAGQVGVAQLTCQAFQEASVRLGRRNTVGHVLLGRKPGSQATESGVLPGAKTLACNCQTQDHEAVVAGSFDLCIVIEGGTDTVCEVENFVWNDCIVLPVQWKESESSLPKTVVEAPQGIDSELWRSLNQDNPSAQALGQAVLAIVTSVLHRLGDEGRSVHTPPLTPPRPSRQRLRPKAASPGTRPKLSSMKTILLG